MYIVSLSFEEADALNQLIRLGFLVGGNATRYAWVVADRLDAAIADAEGGMLTDIRPERELLGIMRHQ